MATSAIAVPSRPMRRLAMRVRRRAPRVGCRRPGTVGARAPGHCPLSVDYVGRLTAHLPMATRLLLVKADGSVTIHADDRAYKPLNWMSPPCWLEDNRLGLWTVRNKSDE